MVHSSPPTPETRPITTLLTPHRLPTALPRPPACTVRFAAYTRPAQPPDVEELAGSEAELIDALLDRLTRRSNVPAVALQEIISNLVHAGFVGACVSVLDDGRTVRVSDCGPGIEDKGRASEPGYTTVTGSLRGLVRGVGAGLPVALAAMTAAGGSLDLDDNIEGGTVVTLRAPATAADKPAARQPRKRADKPVSETGRRLLAIILELGPATPARLSAELGLALPTCTDELAALMTRGMVASDRDGSHSLTDAGAALLSTLF